MEKIFCRPDTVNIGNVKNIRISSNNTNAKKTVMENTNLLMLEEKKMLLQVWMLKIWL